MANPLGSLSTEQVDRRLAGLDEMTVPAIVHAMNQADFAVPVAVQQALPAIAAAIIAAEPGFAAGGRLVYVGAGTSGRLGVLDASECPPTFHTDRDRVVGLVAGGPIALVEAVEGAEDDRSAGALQLDELVVGPGDTVVGLAASGRTPYVTGALVRARERGALTVSVACNSPADLSAVADFPIEVAVGTEVISGSTRLKAGTAQKQVLNMISTTLMVRTGRTYGNLMVELAPTNAKLRERATRLVALIAEVHDDEARLALELTDWEVKTAVVVLRRGVGAADARAQLSRSAGRLAGAIGVRSSEHPALR